ncbi:MAG: hypothetical protein AAF039_16760 [Bacteroidota bacterium]
MELLKTIFEIISAVLIVIAFALISKRSIKGFSIMAIGQLLAAVICVVTSLWFLAIMHFINFVLMVKGFISQKNEEKRAM